jgi:hypothetical protein
LDDFDDSQPMEASEAVSDQLTHLRRELFEIRELLTAA